jgi:hypothetical protein
MKSLMKRAVLASAISLAAVPMFVEAASATVAAPAAPVITTIVSGNKSLSVNYTEATAGASFTVTATAPKHYTRTCHTVALKCTVVGLSNGVTYSVVVTAKNAGGSTASAASTAIVGVPGAPLGLHLSLSKNAVKAFWNPPVASGVSAVTGYTATATDGTNEFSCSTHSTATLPAARTCKISGLTKGTKYNVSVTATNAYGTGAASKVVSFTSL